MPLYEYYCTHCQAKFELLVNHQHADDVVCMKCHSDKVRRLLSIFAAPRGNSGIFNDTSFDDDTPPSSGGCGCGGGGCGCH